MIIGVQCDALVALILSEELDRCTQVLVKALAHILTTCLRVPEHRPVLVPCPMLIRHYRVIRYVKKRNPRSRITSGHPS